MARPELNGDLTGVTVMTGDKDQDRQEAQAMAAALAGWVTTQIEGGADPGLLASALLGIGADLLAKAQGSLTTRDALSQLARDIAVTPEGSNDVH
jgi:hypothetical protein